jgi:hypothetical protein
MKQWEKPMKKTVLIQLEIHAELLNQFESVAETENLTGARVLRQLMREYVFMHGRTLAHEEAQRLESAKRVSAIVALDAVFASNGLPAAMARFADDERDTDELADRQQGWRSTLSGAG